MDGTRIGVGRRLRSLALAALAIGPLALAVVNPHAQADVPNAPLRFSVDSAQMAVAQQIAKDTWGTVPCNGQVTITWTALAPSYNATSTWTNPTDAYNNATQNYDCQVQFNTEMGYDWPKFCTVLVHEFGHLTGHPHVIDPNNVMTPVYSVALPACARTPEPGVTATPPAPLVTPTPAASPVKKTTGKITTVARGKGSAARKRAEAADKRASAAKAHARFVAVDAA